MEAGIEVEARAVFEEEAAALPVSQVSKPLPRRFQQLLDEHGWIDVPAVACQPSYRVLGLCSKHTHRLLSSLLAIGCQESFRIAGESAVDYCFTGREKIVSRLPPSCQRAVAGRTGRT
jgi:hypothetical protein